MARTTKPAVEAAESQEPGTVSAIVLSPLEHDGKSYKQNAPIKLTPEWFDILSNLVPPVVRAKASGDPAEVDPIDTPAEGAGE